MNRSSCTIAAALILALAGAVVAPVLQAQTDYSSRKATSYLTVGPGFAGGASLTLSPPDGMKVGALFAYRIAADATYPLSPNVSATLGLGLDNRAYRLRRFDSPDIYTDTHLGYFALSPGFIFSGFYIGMNFGFPVSGSYTAKGGVNASETTTDMTDAQFDKVETMLEPRIGAVIQLLNDQTGWLALTVTGGYTLSETDSNMPADADSDYHMATGQIGLTYQFAIPGTRK